MPTSGGLTGWNVLITRPVNRAEHLAALLRQQDATIFLCPTLTIELVGNRRTICDALARADLAIFVSVHAVEAAANAMARGDFRPPPNLQIAAVGSATARALEQQGLTVDFLPRDRPGSEGLLEAFAELDPRGMVIEIFAAETGRSVLAEFFGSRGARVNQVVCYRRQPNRELDPSDLNEFLGVSRRLLSITSVESAQALLELTDSKQKKPLLESDLVAISDRVGDECVALGFAGRVQVARRASDQGMVDAALSLSRDTL